MIYEKLCPACGGDLSWKELTSHFCENKKIEICAMDEIKPFEELFAKCVGEPREIQRMWAKRVLRGESFALTAPTGIGKTSFGLAISLFLAKNGKRCYIIFPTSVLVKQAVENLRAYAEKIGLELSFNDTEKFPVGFYHSEVKAKEEFFEKIKDFRILITTAQFLAKNFEKMKDMSFDFIFVDDVDAILKMSKNVERILSLLGIEKGKKGVLVVSTATAKVGKKAELFRKFLNFSIGSSQFYLRNIEDVILSNFEDLQLILTKLGSGGIIYARSVEECERIKKALSGFKVGIVTSKDSKDFELFSKGELDFLVGTAHYYGILVRGIDLPERIKFAIFIGCPVHRIKIEDLDSTPISVIKILALALREDKRLEKFIPKLKFAEKIEKELRNVLKEIITEGKIRLKDVVVRKNEVIFPDIRTYLQASGRTSRLHAKGLTKGASFVFEEDQEILKAFIERAKFYDINFTKIDSVNLEKLREELEESRRKEEKAELIKPALLIVESPTKAKQIARFFGKPSIRFIDSIPVYEVPTERYLLLITATLGHITDLVTKRGFYGVLENFIPIYGTIKKCRKCGHQFVDDDFCPRCGSTEFDDAFKRISVLRKLAEETGFVIIGTDPDTEGEKIAWDLSNLLCGDIKRAEFHEITKREINKALKDLREIKRNLLMAQIVRRIEDRWIGFVLSQKVQEYFNKRHLSAGRAQTPALGWIVERYRAQKVKKSLAFIPELEIYVETDNKELEVKVELIEDRVEFRTPMPPYTTNSLLFDANAILKLSTKEAIEIAQDLFENGLITYHRTDSTRVSEHGRNLAKEYLGDDFKGREWFFEGAHECIRPTRAIDRNTLERLIEERILDLENFRWTHLALYDLIFRRFMASQCKDYMVRVKKYRITANGRSFEDERVIEATGRAYELYKSVWVRKELKEGTFKVQAEIRRIPSAPLLTQAELINLMKEKGIGRPSTYAVIVDRLFTRHYVLEKNGKLIPTKEGISVYDFLSSNYAPFISESRTRTLEEKMDAIEKGKMDYIEAIKELREEIERIC
ncbi:MAG: reverse gyrase [Archaeoglobaceae archaeon]|nr:reverse gyrase [Archaeoglobaceae archaeon]MDW8127618.1 reverse gyrase [Archaeoglobaceae archaeon]